MAPKAETRLVLQRERTSHPSNLKDVLRSRDNAAKLRQKVQIPSIHVFTRIAFTSFRCLVEMALRLVALSWFLSSCASQIIDNRQPIGSSFPVAGENATYDYVIVGAGTAGSALATRLAQDGRYTVAVLEAGSF